MENNYNVDDILSEIKIRKSRMRAGGDTESPPLSEPAPEAEPAPPEKSGERFSFVFDPEPEKRRPPPPDLTAGDLPRRRGGWEEPQPHNGDPSGPIPEDLSNTAAIDFSAFRADSPSAPPQEDHTRVLPRFGKKREPDFVGEEPVAPRSETRRSFENSFYEPQDIQDSAETDHGKMDFGEYNSVEDRRDVATDIARVKLWIFIRTSVTALLTLLIAYLTFAGAYYMPIPSFLEPVPATMRGYLLSLTVLTVAVALVNSSSVGGGLISLFKMRANSDTLSTLALLAGIGQGVMYIVRPDTADPTQLNLYFAIASLAMLFNALGKMTMISRIQTNFRLVASDRPKKALCRVENESFCREFVPGLTRRPTIAYSVQANFFTDFLGLSYSDKYDVGINRAVAPVCLLGAAAVAVVSYLFTQSTWASVSALTAILCISATFSTTFVENIPLSKLTKKLAPQGGMVSGNKAVEDFCDAAAVIFTENDLFPEGRIQLRGIKTFSQGRIDESILDAASVICSLEGALSPVFLQMIGGNTKLLKKVDNVVYENGMGVSAWVDSRRVLIGNALLMQNHGIALPPGAARQIERRAPEDGEMLYLSSSGEVTAQFAVSYSIDEELATQLDLLAAMERNLIIYATDANVTPHRVWELYGYPEELVQVMPAERHSQYREMTAPQKNAVAEIVYTGKAPVMAAALVACSNARSSILSATVLQLVQIILGYGLIAFMAFMGSIGSLNILHMAAYQVFWFLLIFVVQSAKQP